MKVHARPGPAPVDPRAVPRLGHRARDGALDGPPPQLHRQLRRAQLQQQYWQLRTRNGAEKACKNVFTPNTDGTTCVGPRWMDPVTERRGQRPRLEVGLHDGHGLPGRPDPGHERHRHVRQGAMRFMYGEIVDVDRDARRRATNKGMAYVGVLDGFGGIGGYIGRQLHYTQLQRQVPHPRHLRRAVDGNDRAHGEVRRLQARLRPDPRHDRHGRQVRRPGHRGTVPTSSRTSRGPRTRTSGDEPASVTRTCSAPTSSRTSATCRSSASTPAPTPYEQMQFIISTYENRYIFDNFRRDRVTFHVGRR